MKLRYIFFIFSLFFLNSDAVNIPSHYVKLNCELKPFVRNGNKAKKSSNGFLKLSSLPKQASSENWSGYAITAAPATSCNNSGGVTQVYGSWYVPAVVATPGIAHTYSSFWVGIDGLNDSQVEQLGTEQDVVNGVQVNYAWFEMYPQNAYLISGFPVDVGDVITAEVNYNGNNVFALAIVNDTKKVSYQVPTSYTTVSAVAPKSSAEWVVEAPYSNGILPLANFGMANFLNCFAQLNYGSTLAIGGYSNNEFINMINASGALKDHVSGLMNNGANFEVLWQSSQ